MWWWWPRPFASVVSGWGEGRKEGGLAQSSSDGFAVVRRSRREATSSAEVGVKKECEMDAEDVEEDRAAGAVVGGGGLAPRRWGWCRRWEGEDQERAPGESRDQWRSGSTRCSTASVKRCCIHRTYASQASSNVGGEGGGAVKDATESGGMPGGRRGALVAGGSAAASSASAGAGADDKADIAAATADIAAALRRPLRPRVGLVAEAKRAGGERGLLGRSSAVSLSGSCGTASSSSWGSRRRSPSGSPDDKEEEREVVVWGWG